MTTLVDKPAAGKKTKKPKAGKKPGTAPVEKAVVWPDSARPSLMFLPPNVRGVRARKRAVRQAVLLSVGLLVATAGAYLAVAAGTTSAQAGLNAEKAVAAEHAKFLAVNAPFKDYFDGYIARKAEVSQVLERDMANSKVFKAVNDANTVGAVFTTLAKSPSASDCARGDLFAASVAVGCLDLEGHVGSIADVGALAAALAGSKEYLVDPYVTESTAGDKMATFKITVGFTDKALTYKGDKFRPTPDELAASGQSADPLNASGK
ncbi:hypothetical protein [Arthrobacter sp. A2-55]|uniref:hypothetical protein n=1 Tax=Arthrobacter sp. A2-55 TaxID=2897337 RepID=UPI0021CD8ED1|nr:hypothetical protein [Arthrobacter sp. A2-55]MCU6480154.1 hypothetical protein [Arthrobacter sp. A2-55]